MNYAPIPKPAKRRRPGRVDRISKATGERVLIARTEAEWQKVREQVYLRAEGTCERCLGFAPFHDGRFPAGHAHHVKRRGMGGGSRNDAPEVLQWLCASCHVAEHQPAKVVPAKERS